MGRKLLSTLAKRKGGRWLVNGGGVLVILDDHKACPLVRYEHTPSGGWIIPYCDILKIAKPLVE